MENKTDFDSIVKEREFIIESVRMERLLFLLTCILAVGSVFYFYKLYKIGFSSLNIFTYATIALTCYTGLMILMYIFHVVTNLFNKYLSWTKIFILLFESVFCAVTLVPLTWISISMIKNFQQIFNLYYSPSFWKWMIVVSVLGFIVLLLQLLLISSQPKRWEK